MIIKGFIECDIYDDTFACDQRPVLIQIKNIIAVTPNCITQWDKRANEKKIVALTGISVSNANLDKDGINVLDTYEQVCNQIKLDAE